jgi:clan AA aspartic protease
MHVSDLAGRRSRTVEAQVDTGASHSVLAEEVLEELGVQRLWKAPFQLADDRVVEYDVGQALLRLGSRELATVVVFGEPGSGALLGATTLEIFNLGVDPIRKRLIPIRGLLMRF